MFSDFDSRHEASKNTGDSLIKNFYDKKWANISLAFQDFFKINHTFQGVEYLHLGTKKYINLRGAIE